MSTGELHLERASCSSIVSIISHLLRTLYFFQGEFECVNRNWPGEIATIPNKNTK